MLSGFMSLPKDIPIHVIMGNHDYEKKLQEKLSDDTINNINNDCKILENQYNLKTNTEYDNIEILFNKYIDFTHNTKILMIDTTIYDDSLTEDVDCYLKHPQFSSKFDDAIALQTKIETVRNEQSNFVKNQLFTYSDEEIYESKLKTGDNLIIIGHHPISCFKYKNKKIKLITGGNKFIDLLYNNIHKKLKNKSINVNYYYLCADLHQYQIGNIAIESSIDDPEDRMFIKQYIVGTGGAHLDPYYPDEIKKKPLDNILIPLPDGNLNLYYFMNKEGINLSESTNGILECKLNQNKPSSVAPSNDNLIFEFIKFNNERKIEGSKKREYEEEGDEEDERYEEVNDSLKSIQQLKNILENPHIYTGGRFKRKNYKKTSKSKHRMTKKNKTISIKSKKINRKGKNKVKSKSRRINKKYKTKRR